MILPIEQDQSDYVYIDGLIYDRFSEPERLAEFASFQFSQFLPLSRCTSTNLRGDTDWATSDWPTTEPRCRFVFGPFPSVSEKIPEQQTVVYIAMPMPLAF